MLRVETREPYRSAPQPIDEEITAVDDAPSVEDPSLDGAVADVNVRTRHGGHAHRHMWVATRSNAELRIALPEAHDDPLGTDERPQLTDEIVLEQAIFDEEAALASNERVALAARQQATEAHAASMREVPVEERATVTPVSRPRSQKRMPWPEPLDDDEDTAVEALPLFNRVSRDRR